MKILQRINCGDMKICWSPFVGDIIVGYTRSYGFEFVGGIALSSATKLYICKCKAFAKSEFKSS